MKKLLIVLLALTVVGVLAFADDAAAPAAKLSVGGWGRAYVSPITSNGTDQTITAGPGWANGARVGVSFDGSSANFGFDWNPGVSGNAMSPVCDIAKIWAKVSPMLTIQVGKIEGDVLRGKLGDTGDVLATTGNDDIFKRFYPNTGDQRGLLPVHCQDADLRAAGSRNARIRGHQSDDCPNHNHAAFHERWFHVHHHSSTPGDPDESMRGNPCWQRHDLPVCGVFPADGCNADLPVDLYNSNYGRSGTRTYG
jgi:hypothetical protein